MLKRTLPLLIGLAVCGVAFGQATPAVSSSTTITTTTTSTWKSTPPSDALSEDAIKTAIANAGFKEVKDLKFKDGVWRTKARGGNAQWVDLSVGPANGRVYLSDAPSRITADEVKAHLATAGYRNVHDVEYKHGLWSADATSASGQDVDLLVDPTDGSIVVHSDD